MLTVRSSKTPMRTKPSHSDSSFEASPNPDGVATEENKETTKGQKNNKSNKKADKRIKIDNKRPTLREYTEKMENTNENLEDSEHLQKIETLLKQVVAKDDLTNQISELVTKSQLRIEVHNLTQSFELKISELKDQQNEEIEILKGKIHDLSVANNTLHQKIKTMT